MLIAEQRQWVIIEPFACLVELGGVLGGCRSRHFPLLI